MPQFRSSSVREHHMMVLNQLIAAAEEFARDGGAQAVTAGNVAARAGIARNSIYRYVSSINELKLLVLRQYLSTWRESFAAQVSASNPQGRILEFAQWILKEMPESSHAWLIELYRDVVNSPSSTSPEHVTCEAHTPHDNAHTPHDDDQQKNNEQAMPAQAGQDAATDPDQTETGSNQSDSGGVIAEIHELHFMISSFVREQFTLLDVDSPDVWASFVLSVVFNALRHISHGADQRTLTPLVQQAVNSLVEAATARRA
ncbi:MAG: TetR/AcrR family transcriptional regulator [Actinomycetaceae bacterium]|nr:TetR/AcrR family transcriptional regulator [Actinomycetaceae bacterium]MDY6083443.1 TetR/AcrR family transcriptional regulator [Actinomycetaceae bacterium]